MTVLSRSRIPPESARTLCAHPLCRLHRRFPRLAAVERSGHRRVRGAAIANLPAIRLIEQLDTRAGALDAGARATAHRASIYLTGHEELGAGVAIVETIYAQPRIDQPDDLRLLGELAVQSKLSPRLALKDSFNVAYDRTPPDGVKRYDTALEVSLLVTF